MLGDERLLLGACTWEEVCYLGSEQSHCCVYDCSWDAIGPEAIAVMTAYQGLAILRCCCPEGWLCCYCVQESSWEAVMPAAIALKLTCSREAIS